MNCKLERLVRRSVCKNCGEPIRVGNDGCWVHDDPDEDPAAFDYGWARCLPKSEDDFENYAAPNDTLHGSSEAKLKEIP